uniref:Uncharacterized protein n=1 Tax=Rhizophora mucronata TaxID=61149 RepID=A0A2P2JP39_RHIMU
MGYGVVVWNLDEPFISNFYSRMAIFALEGSKLWVQQRVQVAQRYLYHLLVND